MYFIHPRRVKFNITILCIVFFSENLHYVALNIFHKVNEYLETWDMYRFLMCKTNLRIFPNVRVMVYSVQVDVNPQVWRHDMAVQRNGARRKAAHHGHGAVEPHRLLNEHRQVTERVQVAAETYIYA